MRAALVKAGPAPVALEAGGQRVDRVALVVREAAGAVVVDVLARGLREAVHQVERSLAQGRARAEAVEEPDLRGAQRSLACARDPGADRVGDPVEADARIDAPVATLGEDVHLVSRVEQRPGHAVRLTLDAPHIAGAGHRQGDAHQTPEPGVLGRDAAVSCGREAAEPGRDQPTAVATVHGRKSRGASGK